MAVASLTNKQNAVAPQKRGWLVVVFFRCLDCAGGDGDLVAGQRRSRFRQHCDSRRPGGDKDLDYPLARNHCAGAAEFSLGVGVVLFDALCAVGWRPIQL